MKRIYLMLSGLVAMTAVLSAQDKGYLTGSFESNDHFYVNDPANVPLTGGGTGGFDVDMVRDGERFGSNNYLKLVFFHQRSRPLCRRVCRDGWGMLCARMVE